MAKLKAKRFRQIFDYLDQDKDGVIDLLDLTTGLLRLFCCLLMLGWAVLCCAELSWGCTVDMSAHVCLVSRVSLGLCLIRLLHAMHVSLCYA